VKWWVADRSGWLLLSWRTDRMVRQLAVGPGRGAGPQNRFSMSTARPTPWIDGLISADYL
jgi:hypothetical protein